MFEVTRCDGFYCLIMEYFPGGSLCDMIQNNGKLEESIAKQLFGQLIIGLNYIHGKVFFNFEIKLNKTKKILKYACEIMFFFSCSVL